MHKTIIHQISLSSMGGVQRSFNLYFKYAIKNSKFHHSIFGMHDIVEYFDDSKEFYNNLNKSFLNKIKFVFYLLSKNYIIHFYNNLGSRSINKLLTFIPSSNIIFHERGSAWNAKNKDIIIYKKNVSKAKIIIANSYATKILLIKRFGIDKNKIYVVYNGFFPKDFNFIPKNDVRYSQNFSIGYIGRLDTPKAVHIIIKVAKKLPHYEFFIAGKGAIENHLKHLAKDCKNVNFLGSVSDPLEIISKMDIMVVPSIREPFGNIIVESGFCKKPVIASMIDGIPEIIKNGFNGILIEPSKTISFNKIYKNVLPLPDVVINPKTYELQKPKEIDPLKLRDSIIKLSSNDNIRKLYGQNLYNSVQKKYNIDNYHKEIETIYKKL